MYQTNVLAYISELVIEKTQFSELASFQCFVIRPMKTHLYDILLLRQ